MAGPPPHAPHTPMYPVAAAQVARAPEKKHNGFVIFFILLGGMFLTSCMCCIALADEEQDAEDVDYGDVEFSMETVEESTASGAIEPIGTLDEEDLTEQVLGDGGEQAVRNAAIALQVEEAEQMLERGQKQEAIDLCDGLIREVAGRTMAVNGCYNVILRASWNPTTPFDEPDKKACKLLKEYHDAYPDHAIGIGVQRQILDCVAHDL